MFLLSTLAPYLPVPTSFLKGSSITAGVKYTKVQKVQKSLRDMGPSITMPTSTRLENGTVLEDALRIYTVNIYCRD
jgi:hypothetical protein